MMKEKAKIQSQSVYEERLKQPREPILDLNSSKLQLLKTTKDNMERQLAVLKIGQEPLKTGRRDIHGAVKASLFKNINDLEYQIRMMERDADK
jgi:hypothetical protein